METQPETRATSRPTHMGSLVAIALTALVLWVGLGIVMWAVIVVLFGALYALAVVAAAVIGMAAAISRISRRFAGRAHIAGAVTVTLVAVVALGVAFGKVGMIPMLWVTPGFEAAYVLIAVPAALMLGAFLGPLWLRVVGAVAAAGLVGFGVWALSPEPPPPDPIVVPADNAQFNAYADLHGDALVPDVPDWTVASIEHVGDPGPRAWIVTTDGGVVEVSTDVTPPYEDVAHVYPCWKIAEPGMELDVTDSIDDYSEWCVPAEVGWQRPDGTGYSRLMGAFYVGVTSAHESDVQRVGGERPASPDEVSEALESLRPISEEELWVAFEAASR